MKKKIRELPWATIGLSLLMVAFYFAISGGSAYITPLSKMYPLGVSGFTPLGVLTYFFMHIGIKHLVGNLVAFAAFGWVLERAVGKAHTSAIFLLSGIFAGGAYIILHPDVWVVGASASAAGVLFAGFIADPKKMILVFVAAMLLIPNAVLPATDMALNELESRRLDEESRAQMGILEIEEVVERGEHTEEDLQRKRQLEEEYSFSVVSRESLSEGRHTESTTPASFEIHLLGGFFAAAYMWLFKRGSCRKFGREIRALV